MKETSQRIYAFDLLKFIGAIGIATLHFNWKLIPQGYLFVEMFFIISGFLLYLNVERYKQQNYISILIKRIDSFYLFYILAIIAQINQYINGKVSFVFSLSLPVYIFHSFVIGVLKKAGVDLSMFNWFVYIGLVFVMAIMMHFLALYIIKFYHKTICYFEDKE